jgi:hypothetical protein
VGKTISPGLTLGVEGKAKLAQTDVSGTLA